MKLPFLGIEVKIEEVDVNDYVINTSENVKKKLYFQDENGILQNCNLRCGKSVCDGTCNKTITMDTKQTGKIQLCYII